MAKQSHATEKNNDEDLGSGKPGDNPCQGAGHFA